jgi:hypothetical protein
MYPALEIEQYAAKDLEPRNTLLNLAISRFHSLSASPFIIIGASWLVLVASFTLKFTESDLRLAVDIM